MGRAGAHTPNEPLLKSILLLAQVGASILVACPLHEASAHLFESTPETVSTSLMAEPAASADEFEISQYGAPEDIRAFRPSGFEAVEFSPPFDLPYTITRISFSSFTANGVPAVFPSVQLCELDPASGLVNLGSPLVRIAPFVGNPDGANEVPINIDVTTPGRVFFWCVEFPARSPAFPNDYPFLRVDARVTERGSFGSSFILTTAGAPSVLIDRNIVASMFCKTSPSDGLVAPSNFGVNRLSTKFEFTFQSPAGTQGGKGHGSHEGPTRTELLFSRNAVVWGTVASTGAGSAAISVATDSIKAIGPGYWCARAVDGVGRHSLRSNVVWINLLLRLDDGSEPNGRLNEARPITLGTDVDGTIYPAGDQDFYEFSAPAGAVINALAASIVSDGMNDLAPVMTLYDRRGRVVAYNSNVAGDPSAQVTYAVPEVVDGGDGSAQRFRILVADVQASEFSRETAPRILSPASYVLAVSVDTPQVALGRGSSRTVKLAARQTSAISGPMPPGRWPCHGTAGTEAGEGSPRGCTTRR
jgi:hypothetical protein